MVSTGTSAPVLPSNSPFFGSYLFTSYSRHSQHFTAPKTSTTWTTRQWQFESEPNSLHAIHVCSQFSILHPFDLTIGRTLLQAKIQSMRVLKFFHRCSWRFIYCRIRRCSNGWSDQSFRSNVACLSSGAHKPLNNFFNVKVRLSIEAVTLQSNGMLKEWLLIRLLVVKDTQEKTKTKVSSN